jgi:hypothetical protein
MDKVYALISAGSVEYSASDAEISIDEFIAALEEAKEDGATHVLGLSGNYRGAKYVRLGEPEIDYDEDDEF